ncbi:MAG: hypothetical protein MI924_00945 [Chloroflexales bacterium]|nr:hypothetical protein [Chloroflexales bacterium]
MFTILGWHPLLRSTRQGQVLPRRCSDLLVAQSCGHAGWAAVGGTGDLVHDPRASVGMPLAGPLGFGGQRPGANPDRLPPAAAAVTWYRMRAWIAWSFKDAKRGGWPWERTNMSDPRWAERLWLVVALATRWGCAWVTMPRSTKRRPGWTIGPVRPVPSQGPAPAACPALVSLRPPAAGDGSDPALLSSPEINFRAVFGVNRGCEKIFNLSVF